METMVKTKEVSERGFLTQVDDMVSEGLTALQSHMSDELEKAQQHVSDIESGAIPDDDTAHTYVWYGVPVNDRASAERAAQKRVAIAQGDLQKVENFFNTRTSIVEKLLQRGISPIAVLPQSIFDGICKRFGLYRFENVNVNGVTRLGCDFENAGTVSVMIMMFIGGVVIP